jgi:hypothetical protein
LEGLVQTVEDAFKDMNNDIKYLDQLDILDRFDWSKEWKMKLAYLFGQFGPGRDSRIAPFVTAAMSADEVVKALESAITELMRLQSGVTGDAKTLLNHAKDRLESILDRLEEKRPGQQSW